MFSKHGFDDLETLFGTEYEIFIIKHHILYRGYIGTSQLDANSYRTFTKVIKIY